MKLLQVALLHHFMIAKATFFFYMSLSQSSAFCELQVNSLQIVALYLCRTPSPFFTVSFLSEKYLRKQQKFPYIQTPIFYIRYTAFD